MKSVSTVGCRNSTIRFPFKSTMSSRGNMVEKLRLGNLALACLWCNLHKGTNIASIDPDSGDLVRLFDPRRQRWTDHFRLYGARILGTTPIGRVTVAVLAMNGDRYVAIRRALIAEGLFRIVD